MRALTLLLFDIVLISLAIEDIKKRKISNKYPVAIMILAFASMFTLPEITAISRLQGMFVVSVPMTILALFVPGSFGGGDVKLVFACGAFLGWQNVLHGAVAAVFLAGFYCFWLIFIGRELKKIHFAFGPFLSVGFILVTGNL